MTLLYEPRKMPAVLAVDWINTELQAIKDAHDMHYYQNFPDNSVPLFAMQNRYGAWVASMQTEANIAGSAVFSVYYPIPVACTLSGYSTCLHLKTGAGATTYHFEYTATRSPLSWTDINTGTAFTQAYYNYHGSCAISLVPGDCVRAVFTVPTGDTLYRPTAGLRFKAQHTI